MPARSPVAVVAALLAAVSLPLRAAGAEPLAGPLPRLVRVSGEGKVLVRPDVAIVHAGAEAAGKDLAKAVADAAGRMRRIQAALAQAGVPERDVRTTRHDVEVTRAYEQGRPGEITGYTVSDEVRVVVRDLSKLGAILERVVAAGANALRGLSFEKDDPAPERREALARAVADARAKAEAVAKASGVTLGEVVEVSESGAGRPIVPLGRAMAMRAEEAPVSPGELEISAAVEVTWVIR